MVAVRLSKLTASMTRPFHHSSWSGLGLGLGSGLGLGLGSGLGLGLGLGLVSMAVTWG